MVKQRRAVASSVLSSSCDVSPTKKVLVVGAGCAGLGTAWHLNRAGVDVTLYESDDRVGGHANTISADGVDVDTGFMVYNTLNYPNLCAFFAELGVEGVETCMGFSVSADDGKFEWCSDSLAGLMATPSNIVNPKFYRMMRDVFSFNTAATAFLALSEDDQKGLTTGEFLAKHGFSDSFKDYYLIPMTAAIWSASGGDMLGFPAASLFRFLDNHLLLQVSENIQWMTPKNRSQEYVKKVVAELGPRLHTGKKIVEFHRNPVQPPPDNAHRITVTCSDGKTEQFDEVIFACHPDQALEVLGAAASDDERLYLGAFHYANNDTYVHCDEALMPKSKAAWTSWNYITKTGATDKAKPVFVTYWLNKLQSLEHKKPILVSLTPAPKPAADKIFARFDYAHPQYTVQAVKAQRRVAQMQGANGTYFCGAWMGYGFHEDGFRSGLEVAVAVSGKPLPWADKLASLKEEEAEDCAVVPAAPAPRGLFAFLRSLVRRPLLWAFETLCTREVLKFLAKALQRGRLSILLPNGWTYKINGSQQSTLGYGAGGKGVGAEGALVLSTPTLQAMRSSECRLRVRNNWFFVRLALEADLGMARSYIAGEWDVVSSKNKDANDGLVTYLLLLIDNMPTGKVATKGGMDARDMASAWAGSFFNNLWFKLIMDNTIANSRSNIHAHYDLSNELFCTFLDKETMMYSSGLFESEVVDISGVPSVRFTGSLADAQVRKIDALLARLEPISPTTTLLDVGFGWGGISIRAAQKYGCKVVGITLSVEQKALAEERVRGMGLEHLISFELQDYRVFAKSGRKFDRIVSCEMIEAVGHNYLGSFFACMDSLLATDGKMVMQAITMPDSRYPAYVKSADFINTLIFPGGCCPSLSALLTAMAENSTMHMDSCCNSNLHYAETLRRWRYRFTAAVPKVRSLGFDDTFIRLWTLYFCYCEAGFEAQVINLQMLTFSRPGNPANIASQMRVF
ncbi:Mycolic acid cyclopropane synthetase-domain-containing protein [Ochromonadaceae sp. CCMP2298]|nr:Mycolic acid cyclopropane synthetase-domain-containing protein [Ochromonadaceae sp. CCMP2298]